MNVTTIMFRNMALFSEEFQKLVKDLEKHPKVILFGSEAREGQTSLSDIDAAVFLMVYGRSELISRKCENNSFGTHEKRSYNRSLGVSGGYKKGTI